MQILNFIKYIQRCAGYRINIEYYRNLLICFYSVKKNDPSIILNQDQELKIKVAFVLMSVETSSRASSIENYAYLRTKVGIILLNCITTEYSDLSSILVPSYHMLFCTVKPFRVRPESIEEMILRDVELMCLKMSKLSYFHTLNIWRDYKLTERNLEDFLLSKHVDRHYTLGCARIFGRHYCYRPK